MNDRINELNEGRKESERQQEDDGIKEERLARN